MAFLNFIWPSIDLNDVFLFYSTGINLALVTEQINPALFPSLYRPHHHVSFQHLLSIYFDLVFHKFLSESKVFIFRFISVKCMLLLMYRLCWALFNPFGMRTSLKVNIVNGTWHMQTDEYGQKEYSYTHQYTEYYSKACVLEILELF